MDHGIYTYLVDTGRLVGTCTQALPSRIILFWLLDSAQRTGQKEIWMQSTRIIIYRYIPTCSTCSLACSTVRCIDITAALRIEPWFPECGMPHTEGSALSVHAVHPCCCCCCPSSPKTQRSPATRCPGISVPASHGSQHHTSQPAAGGEERRALCLVAPPTHQHSNNYHGVILPPFPSVLLREVGSC